LTRNTLNKIFHDHKSILLFVVLMIMFRSSIADWSDVPTGSMKPTIVEGDRIWVNKLAYELRIPFTQISLLKHAEPAPGDIVIFDSAVAQKRLVKRVIGAPGDRIAMINNHLYVNGRPIYYSLEKRSGGIDWIEHLPNSQHSVRIPHSITSQSNFTETVVPDRHYLVLGDNRNNSADSRVIGFVPRKEIIGRTRNVVISLDYNNWYLPRSTRFLKTL